MKKLTLITIGLSRSSAVKKTAFTFLLALLCSTAQAQESDPLTLIFQSEPGERSFSLPVDVDAGQLHDANGDGTPDLILTQEDNDGNLQAIRVVDLASGNTLWEVQDVPQTLGFHIHINPFLFGFADIDADGKREAVFTTTYPPNSVVLINTSDNSVEWSCASNLINMGADPNCVLAGVTDVTGDGYPELIIDVTEPIRVVQVWSRAQ